MFTLRMRKERKAWETMSSVTAFLSFFLIYLFIFGCIGSSLLFMGFP